MAVFKQKEKDIFEFWDGSTRLGCLIALRRGEDRSLTVDIYRIDEGIDVRVSPVREKPL
jgi:hypothetical protein